MISNILIKLVKIVAIILFSLLLISLFMGLKKTSFEVNSTEPIIFKETVADILKIRTSELCKDDQLNEDIYYFVKEILSNKNDSILNNINKRSNELGLKSEEYIRLILMSSGDNIRAIRFILREQNLSGRVIPRLPDRNPSQVSLFRKPLVECSRIHFRDWLSK